MTQKIQNASDLLKNPELQKAMLSPQFAKYLPQMAKVIAKLDKIKNPVFKFGEFTADGKVWVGLLVREQE